MDSFIKAIELINELATSPRVKTTGRITVRYSLDKIKHDERYGELMNFINVMYITEGFGIKSLIKMYNIKASYVQLRNLLLLLGVELHSNKIANECLRRQRSNIAKKHYQNCTGFFATGVQENIHKQSIERGIQGYYYNQSMQKYVWLRSSWEYIYAKWLDKNGIKWDVEERSYRLSDGTLYRPDFFIYDGDCVKIVEVKGYWKNRVYKTKLLKAEYGLCVILLDDIKPYCEFKVNDEIKQWKQLRRLKLNE